MAALPSALAPAAARVQGALAGREAFLPGFGMGVVAGALGGLVVAWIAARRGRPLRPIGKIAHLLPRTAAERGWAALLSVNAGVSEELFFRLLLPLLLAELGMAPAAAFALAACVFGAAHAYQGWAGVAATTVAGAALTLLYLVSGRLWAAMAAHAAIDFMGLVLLPMLAAAARPAPSSRND